MLFHYYNLNYFHQVIVVFKFRHPMNTVLLLATMATKIIHGIKDINQSAINLRAEVGMKMNLKIWSGVAIMSVYCK